MARKCFISFKTEDTPYKEHIQGIQNLDIIDKSLNEPIDSEDENYIMRKIREDYLADSTVTIHLIGTKSAETLGQEEQKYIKRELQSSLYHGEGNTRNGILGIVLPDMYSRVYTGSGICMSCGNGIATVRVNDETTIAEFHKNYHIDPNKCHYTENDRYCILVRWDNFLVSPEEYIEMAFEKRAHEIAEQIKVRV